MSEVSPLIISISGIRGLVGQSLTAEVVRHFAAAFGTSIRAGGKVVLARDTRPSGEVFGQAAAAALQETGCQVLDLGICSTPGAKLMVTELGADGAIIITASHNPAPWNGLKLIRADGIFLNSAQSQRVETIFRSGNFRRHPGGTLERIDPGLVSKVHLQRILARVEVNGIRRAGLSVAVDPCNGTGALLLPALLAGLGVDAVFINGVPDGRFAHDPEPIPANLEQLGTTVRQESSDIGFAIDPDADRVTLVSERGEPVGEDYTLALAVQAVTRRRSGPVVTTLSTSQVVSDVAQDHGCPVILTPVGEVYVVEKMLEEKAVIGGEGNGGIVLTEVDPGRDAAVGVAVVLEALAQSGRTLSQLLAQLPHYFIEKRKVRAVPAQLRAAIQGLRELYPEAFVHPVEDGIKLYLSGGLRCPWIHLRSSNTEPVVRIIAESETAAQTRILCDQAGALL